MALELGSGHEGGEKAERVAIGGRCGWKFGGFRRVKFELLESSERDGDDEMTVCSYLGLCRREWGCLENMEGREG